MTITQTDAYAGYFNKTSTKEKKGTAVIKNTIIKSKLSQYGRSLKERENKNNKNCESNH